MSDDISSMFASMKESLQRMEEKIAGVAADVENLKKNPQKAAQPPGAGNSGSVHKVSCRQSQLMTTLFPREFRGLREWNSIQTLRRKLTLRTVQ